MHIFLSIYLPAILFIAVSLMLYFWHAPITYLSALIEGSTWLSYSVFAAILALATIFMPVTAMPLIPVVAPVFGPFTTGLLSILGWTLGAVVAFIIARYLGRPILGKFVPLETVDRMAARLPEHTHFFIVILLRFTFPVDIMSYVIGIASPIGIVPYTIATLLGVTWFSFAFAYLGNAIFMGDMLTLQIVAGVSVVLFAVGWYILLRLNKE